MKLPEKSNTFLVGTVILSLFGTGDFLLFSKTLLQNKFMIRKKGKSCMYMAVDKIAINYMR